MKYLSKLILISLVTLASNQPAVAKDQTKRIYFMCEFTEELYETTYKRETERKNINKKIPLTICLTCNSENDSNWKVSETQYLHEESQKRTINGGEEVDTYQKIEVSRLDGSANILEYNKYSDFMSKTNLIGQCKKTGKPKL